MASWVLLENGPRKNRLGNQSLREKYKLREIHLFLILGKIKTQTPDPALLRRLRLKTRLASIPQYPETLLLLTASLQLHGI